MSDSERPSNAITRTTDGVPRVIVPVLSSSTTLTAPRASIAAAPLTITPRRAAADTPDTRATGAARISGQGVATTSTASARTGSPLPIQAAVAATSVTARNQLA